jgi:predicted DsbA family dithiol-disulfide isomerase
MSAGYAHIFALPGAVTDAGANFPVYQFTFNEGGNAYGRVLDEEMLVEFLTEEMGLAIEVVQGALNDLHEQGKAVIGDLALNPTEAAEMGLKEVPTD